jgi:lipopolysaccharide biosynthesis glycosyltransferase
MRRHSGCHMVASDRTERGVEELGTKFAVALVSDENQFPVAVFLASQLTRLNPRDDTDIVIVSDANAEMAKAHDFGVSARLFSVGDQLANARFPTSNYVSRATYYRLYLAELFAGDYRRILYIDLDTYVHDARIFRLLDLEMDNHSIGGVRDTMIGHTALPINLTELRNTLSKNSLKYLNGGINLIDVKRFSAQDIRNKVIELISQGKLPLQYNDQTALNAALDGDWLELSPSFNMVVPLWNSFVRDVCDPVVVHFAGPNKPWHGPAFVEDHPVKPELERFLAATPWKDFRSRFFNVKTMARTAPKLSLGPGLQRPTRPAIRSIMTRAHFDMKGFVEYLTQTPFADVADGITTLDLDRIPPSLRAS